MADRGLDFSSLPQAMPTQAQPQSLANLGQQSQYAPNLYERAVQQYPALKNHNVGYKESFGKSQDYMESWPPNETGSPDQPRPQELPMNQFGVEVYNPQSTPRDVAADITSHHLITADPVVRDVYEKLKSSIEPWQKDRLQEQYKYYQTNSGESRPYNEWEEASGLPAYLRGHSFGQWQDSDNMYTRDQLKNLDGMVDYLKTDSTKRGPR